MELIRLCVTRIYAHWSTDEIHLQNFLNKILSNHITPPSSLSSSILSTNMINESHVMLSSISTPINSLELLPLIFDELCGRADMIGFIRFISDGVGIIGRGYLHNNTSEISNLCLHVIEPICQRFDFVSSSGKIPVALRCILSSIFHQSHGDERIQNNLLLLFVDSFLPRIIRWLLNSNSSIHNLGDDIISIGEQTQLMETIQDLFKICFTRGINTSSSSIKSPSISNGNGSIYSGGESNGSNYTFKSKSQYSNYSLQIHAALSRSKWLISR